MEFVKDNLRYFIEWSRNLREGERRKIEGSLPQRKGLRWILEKFDEGYSDPLIPIESLNKKKLSIIPSRANISREALKLAARGCEDFLEKASFEGFTIEVLDYNPSVFDEKNELLQMNDFSLPAKKLRTNYDMGVIAFVHDLEFIKYLPKRVAGQANREKGHFLVLERAFTKGRWLDGRYIFMSEEARAEYMSAIAAHEFRHVLAYLDDEFPDSETYGYRPNPHCIGISQFRIPVTLCDRCKDGIEAFWMGVKARHG